MAQTKDRYVRVESKNKAGYTVTKWKDTKTGKIVDNIPFGANVKPTGGELGVSTLSDDVKESTAQRQEEFIRSNRDRNTGPIGGLVPDQNLISQAIGREQEYKASQTFDPFRTEMDSMFKQLIENPDFTDQQKFPSLKAMYSLQNSWFDEAYQEPTYSHAIAFTQQANEEKDKEFINESQSPNNVAREEGKTKATSDVNTTKVESGFELKGGPLKSEAQAREDWLQKTRNSPAQQSGAFTGQELWEQSRKSGANKGKVFAEAVEKPDIKSEELLNKKKKR